MSRSALREARSWYQQAFEALKHIPAGREKLGQQIDLHLDLRNVLFCWEISRELPNIYMPRNRLRKPWESGDVGCGL